jgi:hypothetical protein
VSDALTNGNHDLAPTLLLGRDCQSDGNHAVALAITDRLHVDSGGKRAARFRCPCACSEATHHAGGAPLRDVASALGALFGALDNTGGDTVGLVLVITTRR